MLMKHVLLLSISIVLVTGFEETAQARKSHHKKRSKSSQSTQENQISDGGAAARAEVQTQKEAAQAEAEARNAAWVKDGKEDVEESNSTAQKIIALPTAALTASSKSTAASDLAGWKAHVGAPITIDEKTKAHDYAKIASAATELRRIQLLARAASADPVTGEVDYVKALKLETEALKDKIDKHPEFLAHYAKASEALTGLLDSHRAADTTEIASLKANAILDKTAIASCQATAAVKTPGVTTSVVTTSGSSGAFSPASVIQPTTSTLVTSGNY